MRCNPFVRSLPPALLLVLAGCFAPTVHAQALSQDITQYEPRYSIAGGYQFVNSNAPPSVSSHFSPNGGFVSVGIRYKLWLTFAGEAMGSHSNDIGPLGQNLTLTTYTGGPRITFRQRRDVLFGQTMFGLAHGSDSYFPTATSYSPSASTYAVTVGGGVDVEFTHHFALRAVEAQWLHTGFNNGVNSSQNHLLLGAGLVYNLHGKYAMPHTVAYHPEERSVALHCATDNAEVQAGQNVQVSALATTVPDAADVSFTWTSSGGHVVPVNSAAQIETAGLVPGTYRVVGHATLDGSPAVAGDCNVDFRVMAPLAPSAPEPPAAPVASAPVVTVPGAPAADLHATMMDAYFDYDKAQIRPDTEESLQATAAYLNQHPELHVLVGGYSDERGTTEYNIALSARRSTVARDELVRLGVDPSRITTASYGKGVQVCTTPSEPCYQKNRRAVFQLVQP